MTNELILKYEQTVNGANASPGVLIATVDCSTNNSIVILAKGSIEFTLRVTHTDADDEEYAPDTFVIPVEGKMIVIEPGANKIKVRAITTGTTDVVAAFYPRSI